MLRGLNTRRKEYLVRVRKTAIPYYKNITYLNGLLMTIMLSIIFLGLQGFEYANTNFYITDGRYGTIFFALTGLHGLHVIIGTLALYKNLIDIVKYSKIIKTSNNNLNYLLPRLQLRFASIY